MSLLTANEKADRIQRRSLLLASNKRCEEWIKTNKTSCLTKKHRHLMQDLEENPWIEFKGPAKKSTPRGCGSSANSSRSRPSSCCSTRCPSADANPQSSRQAGSCRSSSVDKDDEWYNRSYLVTLPGGEAECPRGDIEKRHWVFSALSTKPKPAWSDHFVATSSEKNKSLHFMQREYFDRLPNTLTGLERRKHPSITSRKEERKPRNARCCAGTSAESSNCSQFCVQKLQMALSCPVRDCSKENTYVAQETICAPNAGKQDVSEMQTDVHHHHAPKSKKQMEHAFHEKMTRFCRTIRARSGMEPLADFYEWCVHKFKNLTRCWRLLDTNLNMKLSYVEFLMSMRHYDFHGDARLIFKLLDRERNGNLEYYHFDPSGAQGLASLGMWADEKFGGIQNLFDKLDQDRNGKLTPHEFQEGAAAHGLKAERGIRCLFQMVDLDRDHVITRKELEFLTIWPCPAWLKANPDPKSAARFKQQLFHKYANNGILAWRKLDGDGHMRVSWDQFSSSCKQEGINIDELAGAWRALDNNLSGWLSMHEMFPEEYKLLVRFKDHCKEVCGSVVRALGNHKVGRQEFTELMQPLGLEPDEEDILFDGLDIHGKGHIKAKKVQYLDVWDVEEELHEEEIWEAIFSSFQSKESSPHEANERKKV